MPARSSEGRDIGRLTMQMPAAFMIAEQFHAVVATLRSFASEWSIPPPSNPADRQGLISNASPPD